MSLRSTQRRAERGARQRRRRGVKSSSRAALDEMLQAVTPIVLEVAPDLVGFVDDSEGSAFWANTSR